MCTYMNALQLQVVLKYPELYDCVCHVRENKTSDTLITDTNENIIMLSQHIRDLSEKLRYSMEAQ